ncbi:MAG: hypothetical protein HXX14_15510 [Bacteroidetes bacterium]|nr:hypothetical protein [Bacteroidota bacterium]
MENNNVMNADKTVREEYQTPELVDLNNVIDTQAYTNCSSGSGNGNSCVSGASGPPV